MWRRNLIGTPGSGLPQEPRRGLRTFTKIANHKSFIVTWNRATSCSTAAWSRIWQILGLPRTFSQQEHTPPLMCWAQLGTLIPNTHRPPDWTRSPMSTVLASFFWSFLQTKRLLMMRSTCLIGYVVRSLCDVDDILGQKMFSWWSYPLTWHDFWLGVRCCAYTTFHVRYVFGACLEVSIVEVWTKNNLYMFIEGQTHFGMQEVLKWVWPSINQTGYRQSERVHLFLIEATACGLRLYNSCQHSQT